MFGRSLALAVASMGLFGLLGCQEDNESGASGGQALQKPANTPSPEDYAKGGGAKIAPETAEGDSKPANASQANP